MERITVDNHTKDSVSVKKQQYTVIEGIEHAVGDHWRRAYVNSVEGRAAVEDELPPTERDIIFAIWGDTPTVIEVKI